MVAASAASSPSGLAPSGWPSPYQARCATVAAVARASSRCCSSAAWRAARRRSISAGSKAGLRAASATRPRPSASPLRRPAKSMRASSRPALAARVAPRSATCSANPVAERVCVPSSSSAAVKPARPGRSGGLASCPARSTSAALTSGTPGRATRTTVRPLASAKRSPAGSASGRAGPSAGLLRRHGSSALIASPCPAARFAASGGGGVGTSGGSTCSPGRASTATRAERGSARATACRSASGVTALKRARSLGR